jgi:uncharacterized protein (UPF0548 family)
MFLARRPTVEHIDRFLRESQDLPLSYIPIGIVNADTPREDLDEMTVVIGHGTAVFERARAALIAWKQFDIGGSKRSRGPLQSLVAPSWPF